jgi:hypothetical protein
MPRINPVITELTMTKFTDQKFERSPLSELEKKLVKALGVVTFLPASYDKRFARSLSIDGHYTWKQKRYLAFIFNKYRKQIRNYQDLAMQLDPDRFNVEVKFERDLFSVDGRAEVTFKDTFKPKKFVS